jgi:acetyltransferase-like isoleucine patch superfamily enzyme
MVSFRQPRLWWRALRSGAGISSSAIVRGLANIKFDRDCRIGRQVELNASQGSIRLGKQVSLGPFVIIESRGGDIHIGHRTGIGPFCILYGHGNLEIGKDCLIASHVVFIPENHRFDRLDVPMREQGGARQGIHVGDDVWLATQVVVLDGVSIGKGAVIGAGAVVTHDIPPYAIAYGVPAKVVGYRTHTES